MDSWFFRSLSGFADRTHMCRWTHRFVDGLTCSAIDSRVCRSIHGYFDRFTVLPIETWVSNRFSVSIKSVSIELTRRSVERIDDQGDIQRKRRAYATILLVVMGGPYRLRRKTMD